MKWVLGREKGGRGKKKEGGGGGGGAVFQVGSEPRLEAGQGGDRHELLMMFIPLCDCSWIQQHSSVAVLL